MKVDDLADFAALKKLAAALWRQDKAYHGAAVMIGAGFSRSAASTGDANSKLPLWNDLSKTLAQELGSSNSTDPLRLAEEYCAYFGKQALRDLVKMQINDSAWTPGELHKSLLELPWSEVLTTNWDTLLERASIEVHQPVYEVVSKQEDLSSACSPRIVKLHGTINITEDMVFTQEDYRKYPQQHAAFVNFARQVFIENELCLLGFSGDDPNFLQWTGWVRDHLATHARRIYLVGALRLTAAKRKYLESINVAPIDLAELVTDYDDHDARHLAATRAFIQSLQSLKPKQAWEWAPTQLHRATLSTEELNRTTQDSSHAARLLEQQLPTLETDRASYPGWLVCPSMQRWQLQNQLNDPFPTSRNLSEMSADGRVNLLYEISWRHSITYEAIQPWLVKELVAICDPSKPCALAKRQQLEVALVLLKNTRWFTDAESESIEKKSAAILERDVQYWPDSANELVYHYALRARDKFDYVALDNLVQKITASDSAWKLRKASLLAELGRFDEGEELLAEAYRELLVQYRNDRNSVYVLSRLAWALWLLRGAEILKPGRELKTFPSNYKATKCNPSDHIEHIQDQVSKALEKQQKQRMIEPSFEPGSYTDNSNTISINNELHPLLLLNGISNSVGMPLRWNNVSFLVEPSARLAELEGLEGAHRFSLAIRAANSDTSDVLNKVFSRTQIACFSMQEVDYLLSHCRQAVEYWNSKFSVGNSKSYLHSIGRLRVFIEVMARVSVRSTPEQARHYFSLASRLAKKPEFHHFWLFDSLNHLVKYTLKSIPNSKQDELLLEALLFPLRAEISTQDHKEWPNPVIKYKGIRDDNAALDRRIDEIIDYIAPCSSRSAAALLRLLPLIESGFLRDSELNKISEQIWGIFPDYKSLPETGLLRYVLLNLPAKDISRVKNLVRHYLYEAQGSNLFDPSLLMDIANAAQVDNVREFPLEDQAVDYFGRLIAWRAKENDKDLFGFSRKSEGEIAELIGSALARSIVPALSVEALSEEKFKQLCVFHAEVGASEAIGAFSYFAAVNDIFVGRVEKIIRQGLQDQDANKVVHSSFALLKWRDLRSSSSISRLMSRLVYMIGSSRVIGLPGLLWTLNQMCEKRYLSTGDIESLAEVLPVVFDNANYRSISPISQESVNVSLVRAACVRLARNILSVSKEQNGELLRILEEAREDALPEVRFA